MAKFYCQSGSFKTIVDAPDNHLAINKFLSKLIRSEASHNLFLTMDERGFDRCNHIPISLIPFLRDAGVKLPPDEALIESACECLGLIDMDEDKINWLLNGDAG